MSQENEKEISFSNSSLLILSKIIIQCFIKLSIICENFQNFKIYKTIRIIILLINGIVLGYYSELDLWNPFFYFIENIFLFFYFIDFLIKQISFGLYKHEKGYLHDLWNIFEFSQIIIGILCTLPKIRKNKYIYWYRGLRPISLIREIRELEVIFGSILMSLKEMINVFILLLFIFLAYAILAVNIWGGIFYRRCRVNPFPINGTFDIISDSKTLCGGLNQCENCYSIFDFDNNNTYFLKYNVNEELRIDELNQGYSTFDNIFKAFLTIYNCMTLNGWSKIMYMVQNGYSYTGSSIFFISLVIILNYLVLNFTIAILMDNIEKNSKKEEESEDKLKLKVIDFEAEANKISLNNKFKTSRLLLIWDNIKSIKLFKTVISKSENHSNYKISYYCYIISQQPIWIYFQYIIIIINSILLINPEIIHSNIKFIVNYIVVILFDLDCLLNIIGIGFIFFIQIPKVFYLIIVISVTYEFIINESTVLSAFYLLKIIHLIKALNFKHFNIMIDLVAKTIQNIFVFFMLIFLLVYVFALIGIILFKGVLIEKKYKKRMKRFDSMLDSLKEVFSLLIGDDWYIDMIIFLNSEKVNKFTVYIYFICTNIFLSILIMNLVIAFLVYHYDNSRKKQKFKELSDIIRKGEKSIGLKRSSSFSFTFKKIKVRELMENHENKFLNFLDDLYDNNSSFGNVGSDKENYEDILNKSDLFDYKIENALFSEKNGVYKFTHDINTDKITSKDNYGFGIIMKKIKKEKAIKILNEQIQKKKEKIKKKKLHLNQEITPRSIYRNPSKNSSPLEKFSPNKKESTKNLITLNFLNSKENKNPIREYKIQIIEENEKSHLDQMYLKAGVEKSILLNIVNKQMGRSFVCSSDGISKEFKSSTLIGFNDNNRSKKKRKSVFQKAFTFFNGIFHKNNKLKNSKSIDKNISRNQTIFSNKKSQVNLSMNSKMNSFYSNTTKVNNNENIRRIVVISNEIFRNLKGKIFSVHRIKNSGFYEYISQSSLFIFHRKSKIRLLCIYLSNSQPFKIFFISITAISSLFLALNTPYINPNSNKKFFFYYAEGVSLLLFWLETLIKIIANGFIFKDDIGIIHKSTLYNRLLELSDSSERLSNSSSQLLLTRKSNPFLSKIFRPQNLNFENNNINTINDNNINNSEINKKEILANNNEEDLSAFSSNSRISQKSSYSSSSKKSLNNSSLSKNNIQKENKTKLNNRKLSGSSLKNKRIEENKVTEPYLQNLINLFDFTILIIHFYIFINTSNTSLKMEVKHHYLKSLVYFLCLRPLRMVSNLNKLRQMFYVLILSIPSILYVLLIALIVFFIYAIVGLNYFKGLLGKCSNENYQTKINCENNNYIWIPQEENFDTMTSSILTLYELATTSGWYEIMHKIDNVTNNLSDIYFVSFMIIGSIFIMNFSVTCVIDTFVALREKMEGDAFLTENQKEWVKAVKMFMKFKPVPSLNINSNKVKKIRKICYFIIKSKWYIRFINCLIFVNIIIMCFSYNGQSLFFTNLQSYIFYFSTFFFISEMIMKITAYKSLFFIDSMNIFDLIIVIFSSLSTIFSVLQYYNKGKEHFGHYDAIPGLIKGIRVLRVFRLINLNFAIKNYLKIILFITPQLLNIFTLLLMFLVIFIILGINLFSTVKFGEAINKNTNFKDAFSSLNTLLRVLTGDQWNEIMHELAIKQENCTTEEQSYINLMEIGPNGCGTWSSYPYFTFFMILNSTIIVNMFIAVIVGTFMEENVDSNGIISTKEIEDFYNLWSKYDPQVKYSIGINRFILFMTELKFPLGLKGDKLFDDDINKHKLRGKVFFSPDKKMVLDEKQINVISEKLGILKKTKKIHILDVIKLINKRYIIAQQDNEEDLQSLEKYKKELKLFDIKQRKVGQKLKKEFSRYHKGYNGITIIKKNTKSHEQIHKNFNSPIRKIRKVSSVPKVLQNKG